MIRIRGLTRRYGSTLAVDDLSFDVRPGVVTGFLGPNGAGKSTTMRVILGLDTVTEGTVTVAGRRYVDLPAPMRTLGALLDAGAVHPHRTAEAHLLCLARSNGIPRRRVGEVLDLVGLSAVAGRSASSRSACASVSASPPPCSVIPRACCSTSRSTGSTRKVCTGFAS
jgi:ABC-2 type transport system ATP-binding protein